MNFWNLKHTKQRLAILQKAEAQKRHLISLIKAKSVVADQSNILSKSNLQSHFILDPLLKKPIRLSNVLSNKIKRNLFQKTESIEDLQRASEQKFHCKFFNISRTFSQNHHEAFKIKKHMKQRQIYKENAKLFTRIIQTSPTIKRTDWIKKNLQTAKYRQNMTRSKYVQPDYSVQAFKLMNVQPNKKYRLKILHQDVATSQSKSRNLKKTLYLKLRN